MFVNADIIRKDPYTRSQLLTRMGKLVDGNQYEASDMWSAPRDKYTDISFNVSGVNIWPIR